MHEARWSQALYGSNLHISLPPICGLWRVRHGDAQTQYPYEHARRNQEQPTTLRWNVLSFALIGHTNMVICCVPILPYGAVSHPGILGELHI